MSFGSLYLYERGMLFVSEKEGEWK